MDIYSYKSYAKINFGLEVLSKRSDGYHNISTIFVPIGLHDDIEIMPSRNFNIICTPDLNIPIQKNLIYKAVESFQKEFNINSFNYTIKIQKKIPMGAGLGGGSSNAATALLMINELSGVKTGAANLSKIALEIGSDVPFFLLHQLAFASGRGENLNPIDRKWKWWTLVVNPGINVSTPWAYSSLERKLNEKIDSRLASGYLKLLDMPDKYKDNIVNHFEPVVFNTYPEIAAIKRDLYEAGAFFALMSGSGSTVYGLFKSSDMAKHAQKLFDNYFTHLSPPQD